MPMTRNFLYGLVIAAFLAQGWAPAAQSLPAEPVEQSDCTGHAPPDDLGCDCCPDGAMVAGGCGSACGMAFALAAATPVVAVSRDEFLLQSLPPARAGPRYLPFNPPPIA
jgi:hypothetical protein